MTEKDVEKSQTALREEEILQYWQDNKIFEQSLEKETPNGDFVFYDGPPFATGTPHYGHLVASAMKDAVPRYWTMRGFRVERQWGWDCHGLPIENIVEKELGTKSKKDIEKIGVAKFNQLCREKIFTYVDVWERFIPRFGRWADMANPYRTMDMAYMESEWWAFKQLYDNNLVYEDYRSMHICPRCETTLAQAEVAEGYQTVKDISVTAKFKVKNPQAHNLPENTYLLAWTTTPWTLPGNVALAVGENIVYQVFEHEGAFVVLAKERRDQLGFADKEVEQELRGADLVGVEYEPLFGYYSTDESLKNRENGWKVYAADFITAEDGTGIAHEAPAFGAEDWELLKQYSLPFVQHVAMDGTFKPEVTDFAGLHVKPKDDPQATDVEIVKYLAHHDLLFSKEKIEHSYPHCWRCDTPLLNYATSSWFVAVQEIKEKLQENAEEVTWSPAHIKGGRWKQWLDGARDWSISRQRFWANTIPVWRCADCNEQRVFGSAAELSEASGQEVSDLHKDIVDTVVVSCICGGSMHRVPDVLDTWFDSGSVPFASYHYPFENEDKVTARMPADFIAEGLDQVSKWFYYQHVLAGALFGKPSFKNVIVNGIVLAEDGRKMSKRLQNYPDPELMVNKYGADAVRLYLLSSPVVRAENLNFSEAGVDEVAKKVMGRLTNVVTFYQMYAAQVPVQQQASMNVLDRWIVARTNELVQQVTLAMDAYELDRASRPLFDFIDDVSTWYLRRSRERIKDGGDDAQAALATLREVLQTYTKVAAPFTPFIADWVWRETGGENSVHLQAWPDVAEPDRDVLQTMAQARVAVSAALETRANAGIKVRQPLAVLRVKTELPQELRDVVADEVNVKEVVVDTGIANEVALDTELTPELIREGQVRELIRSIQAARKDAGLSVHDRVQVTVAAPDEVAAATEGAIDEIKQAVLADEVTITGGASETTVEVRQA